MTTPNVHQIAKECLTAANGDVQLATMHMVQRCQSDDALREAVISTLLRQACYQAVTAVNRAERKTIWQQSEQVARANAARVGILAQSNLLAFPLPGGMMLADATRDDVEAAAYGFRDQADDMHAKAAWLFAVKEEVPDGKLVRDVLSEARLQELREQVANDQQNYEPHGAIVKIKGKPFPLR